MQTTAIQDRYVRRRRAAAELAASLLGSWGLASILLVSFVATAAESTRVPEAGYRRPEPIERATLAFRPPQLAALTLIEPAKPRALPPPSTQPAPGLARLMPHIRKVDLEREALPAAALDNPLLFLADETALPARPLSPAIALAKPWQVALSRFSRFDRRSLEPVAGGGTGEAATPSGGTPVAIPRPLLALSRPDGSTPSASRAAALGSVTPAPAEPEIVAAASIRLPSLARLRPDGRGYLALLQPEALAAEQRCLAEAVYFEARSESEDGQAAVAQVVLNRVKSGLYPESVCGVVYQNRHRYRACQFTFACEGRSLAIREPASWEAAERIARRVLEGETYLPAIGHSTHYHADYVAPRWSRRLNRTDQIGRHIFYRLKPGQT